MAINTYPGFTPTAHARLAASTTSSNVAVAGTPGLALVSNLGPSPLFVVLGTSSAVVATVATGVTILPNQQLFLGVGSNTYIAAITANNWAVVTIDFGN